MIEGADVYGTTKNENTKKASNMKQQLFFYSQFKKRLYSYPKTLEERGREGELVDEQRAMLYLISNMMAVYTHYVKEEGYKEKEILIYWPHQQGESYVRTCIIDYNFERTNVNNVFHLVHSHVLSNQLISSHSTKSGLKFKECTCNNHHHHCGTEEEDEGNLSFDWTEFISYDFVRTLYYHFLNHPQHHSLLTSLSAYAFLIPSSPPPSNVTFIVQQIMEKYYSTQRLPYLSPTPSPIQQRLETHKILIKSMDLCQHIRTNQKLFNSSLIFNNIVFELNSTEMYCYFQSELMTLFSSERLTTQYERYFSNKQYNMHSVVSTFCDLSLKVTLHEGEITIDNVYEEDQHPSYVIVSQAVLSTSTDLNSNCNIYLPFQSTDIDISSYMTNIMDEGGIDLRAYNQDHLCIIESREKLHFKFNKRVNDEGTFNPYYMAVITPGKCTINALSCHYELWTSNMTNAIPFNHLLNTKIPYLSVKKRRRSSGGSSNQSVSAAAFAVLSSSSSSSSDLTASWVTKKRLTTAAVDNATVQDEKEREAAADITYSLFNGPSELENMLNRIGLGQLNQHGSILDFYKQEQLISEIKTVHYVAEEEEEDGSDNSAMSYSSIDECHLEEKIYSPSSPPVFYLNDHLLQVKCTQSSEDTSSPLRHTLYYSDSPLTHIEVDYENGIISFDPIYYNDCASLSTVVY